MPPKGNETSKGPPAFTFSPTKPRETEITVQKPPTIPPKQKDAPSKVSETEARAAATNSQTTNERSHSKAERLILGILQQLQAIYDDANKTRTQTINIKKATFEEIGNGIQQAYEHLKQPCAANRTPSTTENTILDTLTQIQNSVANLETKYNDIEAKIDNTPKTYAEIIKSTSLKESKIEQRTQRRKQQEALRQERQKYGVTLSLKDTEKPDSILAMPAKDIAERCQQAINRLHVNSSDSPHIIGVSKLAKSFRLQFETEEEATIVYRLNQTKDDIWNAAFEGLKVHVPMYGIVVHGIPVADLDSTMMDHAKVIKQLEAENSMKTDTITKITPLRRRKKHSDSVTKLHHSIIIYMNDSHAANRCITNGFHVDYIHYAAERFTPQYQIMQCFNCCDYGHRASSCKRESRCGKCSEKHNTRECKSTTTTAHCFQCKGSHEAWHPQCPARIAEKERLEELMGNTSCLFN